MKSQIRKGVASTSAVGAKGLKTTNWALARSRSIRHVRKLNNKVQPTEMPKKRNSLVSRLSQTESYVRSSVRGSIKVLLQQKVMKKVSFVINPKCRPAIMWDMAMIVLIVYSGIMIPFELGFPESTAVVVEQINSVADVCFYADIVMNFFIGYFDDEDNLVVSHRKIARRYILSWFFIDLVSTLPMEGIFFAILQIETTVKQAGFSLKLIRILKLFRIVKLVRLLKLGKFMLIVEDIIDINPGAMRIMKLICEVLYLAHFLSCIWHAIGWSSQFGNSWLDIPKYYARTEPVHVRYVYSFYWVIASMTAVGYGDLYAVSNDEKVFAIFTQIMGASVFGFIIGNISTLLESLNKRGSMYNMKISLVKRYIQHRKLPKKLKCSILSYYEYYFARMSMFDEPTILRELSLNLRRQIVKQTYQDTIFSIPTFRKIDEQFIVEFSMFLKPLFMMKNEYVSKENTIGREAFFLCHGIVQVEQSGPEFEYLAVLEILSERGYFGEGCFVGSSIREFSFLCKSKCDMFSLNRDDFSALIDDYPEAEEIITADYSKKVAQYSLIMKKTQERYATYKSLTSGGKIHVDNIEEKLQTVPIMLNGHDIELLSLPVSILDVMNLQLCEGLWLWNSATEKDALLNKINVYRLENEKKEKDSLFMKAIINPKSIPKLSWDALLGVFVLYSVIDVPFQISFEPHVSPTKKNLDWIVDCFFGIDIILNFRTALIDRYGNLVNDSMRILQSYIKLWFWIDFISTIPVGLIVSLLFDSSNIDSIKNVKLLRLIKLTKLLKLARLVKLNRSIGSFENIINVNPAITRLTKLLMQVTFVAHISSCIYYLAHKWSYSYLDLPLKSMDNATIGDDYLNSLYWSFTTMTTVGYGDITPNNIFEVVYVTFSMLVGASMFGYIIGSMSSLVDQLNLTKASYHDKMDIVKEYMRDKKLPISITSRVRRYYEFYLQREEPIYEEMILAELSENLRSQLLLHLNRDVVKNIKFFSDQDDAFVSYLMSVLYPEYCIPDEYIYNEGDVGRHMYFLLSGSVQIVKYENIFRVLTEGSYFGELAMLTLGKRQASAKAKTYVKLYVLSRTGMERINLHYPKLATTICEEIKRNIVRLKLLQKTSNQLYNQTEGAAKKINLPELEDFEMHSNCDIKKSLNDLEILIERIAQEYGGGEKGKRKAVAYVSQQLKQYENEINESTKNLKSVSNHIMGANVFKAFVPKEKRTRSSPGRGSNSLQGSQDTFISPQHIVSQLPSASDCDDEMAIIDEEVKMLSKIN